MHTKSSGRKARSNSSSSRRENEQTRAYSGRATHKQHHPTRQKLRCGLKQANRHSQRSARASLRSLHVRMRPAIFRQVFKDRGKLEFTLGHRHEKTRGTRHVLTHLQLLTGQRLGSRLQTQHLSNFCGINILLTTKNIRLRTLIETQFVDMNVFACVVVCVQNKKGLEACVCVSE